MGAKYNYYTNYKGEIVKYRMDSDYDTPEQRTFKSRANAISCCGLVDCDKYKTCDLKQTPKGDLKCTGYNMDTKRLNC